MLTRENIASIAAEEGARYLRHAVLSPEEHIQTDRPTVYAEIFICVMLAERLTSAQWGARLTAAANKLGSTEQERIAARSELGSLAMSKQMSKEDLLRLLGVFFPAS